MGYVVPENQLNPAMLLACMNDVWKIHFAMISMVEYRYQIDQVIGPVFFQSLCVKTRSTLSPFGNIMWELCVTDGFTKSH